ncbi:DUF4845 domain-containing protein [Niveibacterium sp. 24ML]|uniref:DUF4845 domain-containing protein n=1 Tax=Niveibacterium sp. 24ML TaxID=2985512 RepID=UPI0022706DFE|nr:DUF4845 domain-containing protein [Niveibacterium sp. 24ML]MCX9158284.1 DUF4845 domain-containing protein [Niveibacterium sp. 24ML]
MRKRERGISLVGTMIMAALVIGGIVLAMRCVPVYNEYFAIQKAFKTIASSGEADSPEAVRKMFELRSAVDDITSIKKTDLIISKENNRYEISADWQRTVPLGGHVSLLFQFSASSSVKAETSN